MGRVRRHGYAPASGLALVTPWLPDLGHADRNPALELPADVGRKLAGGWGGRCPIPGWIPAALSRCPRVSECPAWFSHRLRCRRLCRQSGNLCCAFPPAAACRLVEGPGRKTQTLPFAAKAKDRRGPVLGRNQCGKTAGQKPN